MARLGRGKKKGFEPVSAQSAQPAPRMGDLTVGDYANGMPNIRLGEMFKSFFRQLFWVIPLFLIGFAAAWHLTKDLKRTYSGEGRVLVQFSDEYAYNPVGQQGLSTGLSQTIDTITLTEAAIMKNAAVIDQVIGDIGGARIAPDAYERVLAANNEVERKIAWMELRNEVGDAYVVMPRAKSSIIDVRFTHEDPTIAVEATNRFLYAYLGERKRAFDKGSDGVITDRRIATEEQLGLNEQAIARFLKANNISDFTSEQEGLRERTEDLKASLNGTRASISETEAALARVEDQLRATPESIDLYRDDRAAQRVAQAELELRQLLAKYLPTSDPVRQKQTELTELRELQSSYGGKASGGRRVGPNPTHQALMTQRNNLAATADSLREREFTLQRQLNSADGKIRRLTALTPEFQNLLRERETLNVRLTSYNSKEQEAFIDAQQTADAAENVKVISYAEYPNKGRNTQLLMLAISAFGWGLVLFFIAMIRVFLDPRLYAVPGERKAVVEDPLPLAADAPAYDPIPEPVPAFDPGQPHAPNPYEQPAVATEYVPPAAYDYGSGYAQSAPPAHTNAAVDYSHNPYATGEAQAGAFAPMPGYTGYVDAYGNPVPPPVA